MNPTDEALKRGFDLLISSSALALLGPSFVAIAAWIKLDSRGPIFYRGERVGQDGKPFKIMKFRTMRDASAGPTSTSEDDPRITNVGRILRRYKLDELPQFLNVFLGDMSVVGPRPQVLWCVATYLAEEREILSVRPGITDWSSIYFWDEGEIIAKSGIPNPDEAYLKLIHPEKMRMQLRYVRERSIAIDARIVFETMMTVFRRKRAA